MNLHSSIIACEEQWNQTSLPLKIVIKDSQQKATRTKKQI